MTARWVVEEVAPARDISVTWRSISLLLKNKPATDSPHYERVNSTHKMLRVMEAVRAAQGEENIQALYWEFGSRIHHDKDVDFDIAEALKAVGLDESFAAAFEDEAWDAAIEVGHNDGLALVGNDVGTPIIAFADANGDRTGIFGPVITRVPNHEHSLQLWDGLIACATVPGFWELKRTRTERPDLGERPVKFA